MQKVTLSALAALMVSSAVYADTMTLYTDPATGQVFTTPAEGRVEMGDFIDAKTVYLENQEQDSAIAKEKSKDKSVKTYAKTSKLEFSGTHYLGFVATDPDNGSKSGDFEMRRNYVQLKAFLFDDPKSYARVTLDNHTENGYQTMHAKYAYIYLNEVLPYTGVEFGIAHRPWLDYEEHTAWWYRSIDKTFVESKQSADMTNSADYGVNFKTKTPYFTSEVGLFNGEGYHADPTKNGKGISFEWRTTAALLGNGEEKRKAKKNTYWDASFWGQYNGDNVSNGDYSYVIMGLHTVYNQPSFLVAAHYMMGDNHRNDTIRRNGEGVSVNAEYRFGENYEYSLLARYDHWVAENTTTSEKYTMDHMLYGIAWEQNKNLTWILNGKTYDPKDGVNYDNAAASKYTSAMLTAEVHW